MKPINRYFLLSFIVIFALLTYVLISKNKPSHWLIYSSRPIGTYEKNYSQTLFSFTDKNLFINNQAGNIFNISEKTGKILWSTEIENYSPFAATVIDSKNILINGFDSNLYLLNQSNGIEKWRFTNSNNTYPDTPTITDENDEAIFFGDRFGSLYSIAKENGKILWEQHLKKINIDEIDLESNPIHFGRLFQDENNLYIRSSTESRLISFDKKTGNINWKIDIDYEHRDILIKDKYIILNVKKYLYAIDKDNGQVLWKRKFEYYPDTNDVQEQFIYIASETQKLDKIDVSTGENVWSIHTAGEIKPDVIVINDRGYLFHHLKGNRNNLVVFSIKDGITIWENNFSSDITAKYLSDQKQLFLGSIDGQLFLLDPIQEIITNQLIINGNITNIFQSKDDLIITSISEGNHAIFYKLSQNFDKIWSYKTPYKVATNSISFNNDHVLFTDEKRQLVGSINTKSNSSFDINDFNFDTNIYENKKQISKMFEYLDYLPSEFLSKLENQINSRGINFKEKTRDFIIRFLKNWQLIKNNSFDTEANYDGSIIEITLKSKLANLDQPLDSNLKVSAIFTSPSNKKYNLQGFLYQKNTWKVRFRPDEIGNWSYQIKDITFKKIIEIPEISNIKFVKFNDSDSFSFYLEDGSKYYPLGLEDVMLDINYDKNPLNQLRSATTFNPSENQNDIEFINFDNYLNQYSNAGFNLYRWGVGNASFTLWQELSNYQKIDFMNNKYGDELVKELRKQNYHIMMTLFGFQPPSPFSIENQENQKIITNYLNHVIPRYSSYVDIWEITNEAEVGDEWLEFVINHIKKIDPYHHPISTNWNNPQSENLDLQSIHWYGSENIFETAITTKNYIENYKKFNKPILFSEIGNQEVSWDLNSAQRMRVKLWSGLFNQAYFVIWNQPGSIYYNDQNANIYLGPKERSYTKIFSEFANNLEVNLKPFETNNQNSQIEVFGLKNENKAYIYISKTENSKDEIEIEIPFTFQQIKWMDTETGLTTKTELATNKSLPTKNKVTLPSFYLDLIGEIDL